MSAPTDELKEKIRQLESDEAFLELSKKYNALNLFEILKITKAEIRHSNFLAWLLDPKGNHRLQDRFLRAFAANFCNIPQNKKSPTARFFSPRAENACRVDRSGPK